MNNKIVVISGCSGVGKNSVVAEMEKRGYIRVVTYTTRDPRPDERDGFTYHFVPESEFDCLKKSGQFLESSCYGGNWYGTPKYDFSLFCRLGRDIVLILDKAGALAVRKKFPEAVLIFIAPPSMEDLEERLKARGGIQKKDLQKRLDMAGAEMSGASEYDYVITNRNLMQCVDEVCAAVEAEKHLQDYNIARRNLTAKRAAEICQMHGDGAGIQERVSEISVDTPLGTIRAKTMPGSEFGIQGFPGIFLFLAEKESGEPGAVLEYDPDKEAVLLRVYSAEDPEGDPDIYTIKKTE